MLNTILKLDKKKRSKLIKYLSKDVRYWIFKNVYTLTEELGLDQIEDYETRVKLKYEHIKKFPDIVFWDYLEYQEYGKDGLIRSKNIKVSTNGDVVRLNSKNVLHILSNNNNNKNKYNDIKINGSSTPLSRTISSTFINKPERLIGKKYSELEVNHIDFNTRNNNISNLEWVTGIENRLHYKGNVEYRNFNYKNIKDDKYLELRLNNQLVIIGEILVGKSKNKKFIFNTRLTPMINYRKVNMVLKGLIKEYVGCKFYKIKFNEIDFDLIDFNKEEYDNLINILYFPIEVTNPINGKSFLLANKKECHDYFQTNEVYKYINKNKSYRGFIITNKQKYND